MNMAWPGPDDSTTGLCFEQWHVSVDDVLRLDPNVMCSLKQCHLGYYMYLFHVTVTGRGVPVWCTWAAGFAFSLWVFLFGLGCNSSGPVWSKFKNVSDPGFHVQSKFQLLFWSGLAFLFDLSIKFERYLSESRVQFLSNTLLAIFLCRISGSYVWGCPGACVMSFSRSMEKVANSSFTRPDVNCTWLVEMQRYLESDKKQLDDGGLQCSVLVGHAKVFRKLRTAVWRWSASTVCDDWICKGIQKPRKAVWRPTDLIFSYS